MAKVKAVIAHGDTVRLTAKSNSPAYGLPGSIARVQYRGGRGTGVRIDKIRSPSLPVFWESESSGPYRTLTAPQMRKEPKDPA